MDEAGTSENEPVAVVVGLITHAPTQWDHARALIAKARLHVPENLREGFIFHATDVWAHRDHSAWSPPERWALMNEMLSIPRTVGLSIAYGVAIKGRSLGTDNPLLTKSQQAHFISFANCVEAIDEFMKRVGWPNEMALLIAEDVVEMRRALAAATIGLKSGEIPQNGTLVEYSHPGAVPTTKPLTGYSLTDRIVGPPCFVAKDKDPILQIADACAFALRRFWAGLKKGDQLAAAILGTDKYLPMFKQFETACCSSVFLMVPEHLKPPGLPPLPFVT